MSTVFEFPLYAKVYAYKGLLVLELCATESNDNVATSIDNPDSFGQVIMDTQKHLGVSPEALALLKPLSRGRDSLGDLDWFTDSTGRDVFAWIGGPYHIVSPAECETTRDWDIRSHVVIENTVPQGAKDHIDTKL